MSIRVGTCSWADRTFITASDFYPPHVRSPDERLRFYASRFPLVEVDSTFYRIIPEAMAITWDERTPRDFVFNIKAFRIFTHHPCPPSMLPRDVREQLSSHTTEERNLYWRDLPATVQAELWRRFWSALQPLHYAKKLGAILLQFPPWVFPSDQNREHILGAQQALRPYRLAVEFRDVSWVSSKNIDRTMDFLSQNDLTYVCVDEPQTPRAVPPILRVTTPSLSMLRFHGRNAESWVRRTESAAERHRYLYSEAELEEWRPRIGALASMADETHVLFANCYRGYCAHNAMQLTELLAREGLPVRRPAAELAAPRAR
jgi:uncharacterized protein YecE (DUF72 family)